MKVITVGQLRQNPTRALDEVAEGETYVVTRHRREVARLVPPARRRPVAAAEVVDALRRTPLRRGWADDLAADRAAVDAEPDPWNSR